MPMGEATVTVPYMDNPMFKEKKVYKEFGRCLACKSSDLQLIVDLGDQYVNNFPPTIHILSTIPIDYPRTPLVLMRCEFCLLLQLKYGTFPDLLYRNFWYESGINQTMKDALADVVRTADKIAPINHGDLVIDIGCNDGTLLRNYDKEVVKTVGFEPAHNLAEKARQGTTKIYSDYFSYIDLGQKAKHIFSIAMFYDLEDPHAFVSDVARMLSEDGVWVNQLTHAMGLIKDVAYDAIGHEHLTYYSLTNLETIYRQHGLKIIDVTENSINGGSYRVVASHEHSPFTPQKNITSVLAKELSLISQQSMDTFVANVYRRKAELLDLLNSLVSQGKTIHAYGASTKGNTLLQFCGIDERLVKFAADRNPAKWGRYTIGSWIPIISEDESRAAKPDYYLVLPWSFIDEFTKRETEFLESGGKFIVPLPKVKVIGASDL